MPYITKYNTIITEERKHKLSLQLTGAWKLRVIFKIYLDSVLYILNIFIFYILKL